ncbi:MAG: type II secretion system protein GspG [Thiolinea sp.]
MKKGEVPLDAWNNEYQYKRPGSNGHPMIWCRWVRMAVPVVKASADITLWKQ